MFNQLLSETQITTLDVVGPIHFPMRKGKEGQFSIKDELFYYPEYYIMSQLSMQRVITPTEVLVADAKLRKEVEGVVAYHRERFASFIEEYKDTFVPHEVYVEWLLKRFPGRVKLRRLSV